MKPFNMGAAKVFCLGVVVSLATPVAASRVEVSANAGHHLLTPNGEPTNQTVYTSQHQIINRLPTVDSPGDITRRDDGVLTITSPGSSEPRWDTAAIDLQSSARAYADLSTGKVGAYAGTSPIGFASSSASIYDTLTFDILGGDETTITTLRFLLTLHATTANASGVFVFRAGGGNFTRLGDLDSPYYGITEGWSESRTWFEGTTRYMDLAVNLRGANPVVGIEMTLEAISDLGRVSDFYNTAGLQLQAPSGVTYTSESGVFLTATSSVPEPASWAMLIVGFGVVGAAVRRNRMVIAST